MIENLYTSGNYLEKNPGWHVEESPWKARKVIQMLQRNHLEPQTICEVGCGVGEVLKQLQEHMEENCTFVGYDISPQAIGIAQNRANERLYFKLADIQQEHETFFDLILVMDVVEHLEDYFSFLRAIAPKSAYKIFHIPLDLSAQTVLRPGGLLKVRNAYGHLHYFTKETALQAVRDTGYNILDYCYTARALEIPSKQVTRNLMNIPRRTLFAISPELAAHALGGWSLLILATQQKEPSATRAA
jgi:SAM-dependent methyltransferase